MACPEPPDGHVSHSKREVADRDFRGLRFELRPTFLAHHQVLTELPAPGYFVQRSPAHPLARNQRVNTPLLSGCCQAVKKLSTSCQEKKYFLPKHIFSSQQTKILTLTQKFPKIETDEIFRVAVKKLSRSCQRAVGALSGPH